MKLPPLNPEVRYAIGRSLALCRIARHFMRYWRDRDRVRWTALKRKLQEIQSGLARLRAARQIRDAQRAASGVCRIMPARVR